MNRGKQTLASTQAYLPIKEVKEGVVVMNDGSLRAVLIVSSLNFALKSEQEKDAIISSYQSFLNSLAFPIQIVSTSKKLNLSRYISNIRETAEKQQGALLKIQTQEYANFIEKLLEVSNIMEKRFYVVVPYYTLGAQAEGKVTELIGKKKEIPTGSFEDSKKKLLSRLDRIIEGLTSMGLRCSSLESKDLLELYYVTYNPDTASNQRLADFDNINQGDIIEKGQGEQNGTV